MVLSCRFYVHVSLSSIEVRRREQVALLTLFVYACLLCLFYALVSFSLGAMGFQ